MDITRIAGAAQGLSQAVGHAGTVFAVATAVDKSADLKVQTEQTLAQIERSLVELGTDETKLLSATVYLSDIGRKAEMDEVWNAWIGPDNWRQRACVGVALAPGDQVEIVAVAAR